MQRTLVQTKSEWRNKTQ